MGDTARLAEARGDGDHRSRGALFAEQAARLHHTFRGLGLKGPGSERLYQAVGIRRRISISVIVDKPRPSDIYVRCSDGLSNMVRDDDIREVILQEQDLQASVYGLIEVANAAGARTTSR